MSSQTSLIIERIRKYAAANKLRPSTFARRAGLHPNALRDMHSNDWHPRFDTLQKLEALIETAPEQAAE